MTDRPADGGDARAGDAADGEWRDGMTFKLTLQNRRRPKVEPMATVEEAREWFRRFGFRDECISPTGRRMFEALLRAVNGKAAKMAK